MVRTAYLTDEHLNQLLSLALRGNQNQRRIVLDMIDKILIRFSLEKVSLITTTVLSLPRNEMTT